MTSYASVLALGASLPNIAESERPRARGPTTVVWLTNPRSSA
jgi:hypothetical protein